MASGLWTANSNAARKAHEILLPYCPDNAIHSHVAVRCETRTFKRTSTS